MKICIIYEEFITQKVPKREVQEKQIYRHENVWENCLVLFFEVS